MSSNNILLFQRLVPHYRVPIFRKLNKELGIVVCHSKAKKGASLQEQKELDYPNELLKSSYVGKSPTAMKQKVWPILRKYKPGVVVTEFSLSYITFWCLMFYRTLFHYKLVVWTHGVKSKDMLRPFQSWQSKLQLWVYNRADAVILYSKQRKDILAQYIKDPQKLFVAHNTLDTDELDRIYNDLKAKGKESIQKELGFQNKQNLVFIGRLIPDKRLDLLFDAFTELENDADVGLHIIGSGPEEELVKTFVKKHNNIYYHGPIHDLELSSKYLFAADLMVMPGYVGLSVVHAMAMGCPVLTCTQGPEGPFHSPEVAYVLDGINGQFCEYTAAGLQQAMIYLLKKQEPLQEMSDNARKTIQDEASLDRFVAGFEQTMKYVGE